MKTLSKKLLTAIAFTLGLSSAAQAVELYSEPLEARIPVGTTTRQRVFQCSVVNVSSQPRNIMVELVETNIGSNFGGVFTRAGAAAPYMYPWKSRFSPSR